MTRAGELEEIRRVLVIRRWRRRLMRCSGAVGASEAELQEIQESLAELG